MFPVVVLRKSVNVPGARGPVFVSFSEIKLIDDGGLVGRISSGRTVGSIRVLIVGCSRSSTFSSFSLFRGLAGGDLRSGPRNGPFASTVKTLESVALSCGDCASDTVDFCIQPTQTNNRHTGAKMMRVVIRRY